MRHEVTERYEKFPHYLGGRIMQNELIYESPTHCGRIFFDGAIYGIDHIRITFPFLHQDANGSHKSFCTHVEVLGVAKSNIIACEGKEVILEFPLFPGPITLQTVSGCFRFDSSNRDPLLGEEWRIIRFTIDRTREHWVQRQYADNSPVPIQYGCWPIPRKKGRAI